MPEIVFDGKRVSVPAGTNLIEAGNLAGVPVPVFCYHKDLGAVGSCRVCAVTATVGGKSRLVMGCMTEAADGMEVTTLDQASVALRKYVLEWLMVNHPHDCPICDEGGECQLQDLTIACGHGQRRYDGPKRTFANQYLGEFIQHEMNRCITCYRCSRFYQEYAGGRDFGPTGSRDRVYFGRFEEGRLESPFSGNLIELCPTGVFTDKLFRYKSRVWDLEIAHSVCPHCSVGCNIHPGARHRMLQRVRVRENPAVNGVFLCDRGQFGHGYVMDPARPHRIRVRGQESTWEDALGLAAGSLLAIAREHGPSSIALVASSRASLEAHASLEAIATGPLEGARISHFDDPAREVRAVAALQALATTGAAPLEQSDIEGCDVLLIAGTSLVDEAPLAALAARQTARGKGRVFVLNAGEHYLGDVARVGPVHPAKLAGELEAIARGLGASDGGSSENLDATIAAALSASERPGILMGCDLLDGAAIAAGAKLAQALKSSGKAARLGFVFPGPNGFGAAALSRRAALAEILDALEGGKLRAAVVVESDLAEWGSRAREALSKLELLVVLDDVAGDAHDLAHILLPTRVTYEAHGTFVNRAGRAQAFAPARVPGLSVIEMIEDETFPRTPRATPPESSARAAWWVLEMLRERAAARPPARTFTDLRQSLARSGAFWQPLHDLVAGSDGNPLDVSRLESASAPPAFSFATSPGGLQLFRCDRTLGSEVLSRRSEPMRENAGPPVVYLAPPELGRLSPGASAGNGKGETRVRIEIGGESVEVLARARATMPEGMVLLPRDVEFAQRVEQGAGVRVSSAALEEARR